MLEEQFSVDDVLLFRVLAEHALHAAPERVSGGVKEANAPAHAKCALDPPSHVVDIGPGTSGVYRYSYEGSLPKAPLVCAICGVVACSVLSRLQDLGISLA